MSKSLTIRGIGEIDADAFAAGAAVRNMTQSEYFSWLLEVRRMASRTVEFDFEGSPAEALGTIVVFRDWMRTTNMVDRTA